VLNWGPWLGSRYGSGMVSADTRRKFEGKGIGLVESEAGALVCRDEIMSGPIADVEIVVGEGPWEAYETRQGAVRTIDLPAIGLSQQADSPPGCPLLIGAKNEPGQRGGRSIVRTLSLDTDLYFEHHRIDSVPVLPAAVAAEMAAEAAAMVWPTWQVAEISEFKLLQGFRLEGDRPRELEITVLGSEHGDASGFKATVELRSPDNRRHYRASILLSDHLPEERFTGSARTPRASLSAREAYRNLCFVGPCLQSIVSLTGVDERGAVAQVRPGNPAEFRAGAAPGAQWLFDPALIDTALQLGWIWSCQQRDTGALPSRFGCIRRFANAGRAHRMLFEVAPDCFEHEVRADVLVLDEAGRMVFTIEGLESTANASLNRFRGWAGEIRA
jgi:Polyketide synthase dehydratase